MRLDILYILTIAFPLLPILWVIGVEITTIRRHRAAERAKRAQPTVAAEPLTPPTVADLSDPKAFHEAEFTALKSEIVELVKAAGANFQYAVLASGAIFAWIASTSGKPGEVPLIKLRSEWLPLALWLPFLLSSLFFVLTAAGFIRMRGMAHYIRKLEDTLGVPQLGWEKVRPQELKHHIISPVYLYGWTTLLAGDWILAFILPVG